MEWPPKSGKLQEFPEIDRGDWFPTEAARAKLLKGQVGFLDQLALKLGYSLKPIDEIPPAESSGSAGPNQGSLFD